MQAFVGQILSVGFNFAPVGWAECNGQLLSISQYDALFTLIGTTYGGDGVNTFALPNLNGRIAVNQGQGQGLSPYVMGQLGGTESVALSVTQNGSHSHPLAASSQVGTTNTPASNTALAQNSQIEVNMYAAGSPDTSLLASSITPAGGNQPHENRQPLLAINYIISLFGIYPSQG